MTPGSVNKLNERMRNHTKNSSAKAGMFRDRQGKQKLRVKGVF
jgi:hypothetical protein